MPSFGPEGSALVVLEAMAHSLPCILSDLGTNQEISDSGAAALHFRCGDSIDLRTKLEVLIHDPQKRLHYAQAAFARTQSVYHPEAAIKAYSQLFASPRACLEAHA
jgi:glycosyltransferase involved in cell wall biosynthesis